MKIVIGVYPAAPVASSASGRILIAENLACTDDLTHKTDRHKSYRESKPHAQSVKDGWKDLFLEA